LPDNRLVEGLKLFGLTGKEAEIYLFSTQYEWVTASQLQEFTGLYRSQLHYILNSLIKKGFMEIEYGRPILYRATDPKVAIETYRTRFDEVSSNIVKTLSKQEKKLSTDSEGLARIVKGDYNILLNAIRIVENAKNDLFILASQSFLEKISRSTLQAVKRGVRIYVCSDGVPKKLLSANGVQAKRLAYPSLLLVADSRFALISGHASSKGYEVALIIDQTEIIDYLMDGFYTRFWLGKEPLKSDRVVSGSKYTYHKTALEDIDSLLKRGLQPKVRIHGKSVAEGSDKTIEGCVKQCIMNHSEGKFYVTVEDSVGRLSRVGGRNATEEDVRAELIELIEAQP
jgi:sugar-specific transcriptional regulator TrmB